jgi:glyoxylate reductase
VKNATGLVCFIYDHINRQVIDSAPALKVIANVAMGFNNIDVAYAATRGVWITNTPGVLTEATADAAMALLLSTARHVVPADRYVRKGKFKRWEFNLFPGADLHGRKLGIVGMGAIGQAVARRAQGFGLQILYADTKRSDSAVEKTSEARYVTMAQLLQQADFISLHVPLNESTFHLLGATEFQQIKRGAILINTSRGPVIHEKALVEALSSGRLAGAGLDVYEHEPQIEKELLDMDNVVLLPHIASSTTETRLNMALVAARNIAAVLQGKRPPNPVNDPAKKSR